MPTARQFFRWQTAMGLALEAAVNFFVFHGYESLIIYT